MDTSPAVPSGGYLQGTIVPGPPGPSGHPASAADLAAHEFFNVLRHVVRHVPHLNEDALDTALRVVDDYESRSLDGPIQHVIAETDHAKREDVSKRVAPQTGTALAPVAGPALDYNKLAAALLAAQAQAQQDAANSGEGNPA